MSENIVSQEDYERGKAGCILPEDLAQGKVYTERRKLLAPNVGSFALDNLVHVVEVLDRESYFVISGLELSEDGEPVGTTQSRKVTKDGIILNPDEDSPNFEQGYFLSGVGDMEAELQEIEESLLIPVRRRTDSGLSQQYYWQG